MIKRIIVWFDNFFYRKFIKGLLKTSKLGYGFVVTGAESGVNFEHIYDNKSTGTFFIGKIVDRMLLNLPAVRATRGRKEDVKKILWNEIQNNSLNKQITKVLDLASGGARYLREFSEEHHQGSVQSICIDKSSDSIRLGKELAKKEKISNIKFFRGDIFSLEHLKRLASKINWIPNVIVASGIFIYFNDSVIEKILKEIHSFLPAHGLIIFTSYEKLDTKKLMRKAMQTSSGAEWTLYYRKPEFWRKLLHELQFKEVFILRDQWNMNNVCCARK